MKKIKRKKIKHYAYSKTTISNKHFEASTSASASAYHDATTPACLIASAISNKSAISKMEIFLKMRKLKSPPTVVGTTYNVYSTPVRTWTSISISGANAIACVNDYSNPSYNVLWHSTDYGQNWVEVTNSPQVPYWSCVSIRKNHAVASTMVMVSGKQNITLYYSIDSGVTWNADQQSTVPTSGVSINDLIVIKTEQLNMNSQQTTILSADPDTLIWSQSSYLDVSRTSTSISSSDSNAVLCEETGYIHYSYDYGKNWARSNSGYKFWMSVSISGQNSVACNQSDKYTYFSVDGGQTWTTSITVLPTECNCVSISGIYAVAGVNGGYIYYSSDYGQTWSQSNSLSLAWWRISIDGVNAIACEYSGHIYYSSDSGKTWNAS